MEATILQLSRRLPHSIFFPDEPADGVLRVDFDCRLKLEFHGSHASPHPTPLD
jgi:hypothetical protein